MKYINNIEEGTDSKQDLSFLLEGVMSDLHLLAKEVKTEDEFIKKFFKEHGDKVKKTPDSVEWVKSLYKDTIGESVTEGKEYKIGDKYKKDFDFYGMLEMGSKAKISMPVKKLQQLFDSFESVNYHREGSNLSMAIDELKDKNKKDAKFYMDLFNQACEDTLEDMKERMSDARESVNEKGKGLWANIRAKRARGEAPAKKGSKAYKKAKAAADEINDESVTEGKKEDKLIRAAEANLTKVLADLKANLTKFKNAQTPEEKEKYKTEAGRLTKLRKEAQANLDSAIVNLHKDAELEIKENKMQHIKSFDLITEGAQYKDLYKEAKKLFKGKVKGNSKAFSIPYEYGTANIYDGRGGKADVSWESGGSTQDTESMPYEEVIKMINYYWTKQLESVNEKTSVKKGDYVLYKGNGTKWVKSKIMQVIPSAKKLHIDWNDEYIEVDAKDVKPVKESVNEAFIGPFVFNDKMSDDELKAMYDGALDGYAYHQKGFQYPKSKYKQAYQAIEKILKKRGVKVDESITEGKMYKVKELSNLWYGVYGEPLSYYDSFLADLERNYRRGISKDEIANLWDKHYGEDMEQDYSGFYDQLEESVNENKTVKDIKDALKKGRVNVGSMVDVSTSSNNKELPKGQYAIMPFTDMGDYFKVGDLKRFADKVVDDLNKNLKGEVELVKVDTGKSIRSYIVKVNESVNEMKMVNKKTGKDITKHVLDLMMKKISQKEFEKLTGLKKDELQVNESIMYQWLITEGQFSWLTQDRGEQIGSERQNTITVYMFDHKGNKWMEKRYEGYGEFGGMDYYDLLAAMNGYKADRQIGIDLAFNKIKTKDKGRKTLFPALVSNPRFNWKQHDFTKEAESDPNQSWYQEDDYDDEYGW